MQGGEQHELPPPRPIDGGRVAQAIVEYIGNRLGTVTYRGRSSGREYHFDASPSGKRKYVRDEDLELFQLHRDFRVPEEGRIDREADEREVRDREIAELRAQVEKNRSREDGVVIEVAKLLDDYEKQKEHRPARRRGGRPPVPLSELQRLWHLRHHCYPSSSIKELAARIIESDNYDPEGTVSARLYRFKKRYPQLTRPDRCSLCLEGCYPPPRS